MKMEKNTKRLIALATIAFIAFASVAIAAYWIYSTVVRVPYTPLQYTLTLDGKQINDTAIELTATLTCLHFGEAEAVPVSGATIHFYLTYENGTIIEEIGTAITDETGVATFVWTVPFPESPATVDYHFKAGYQVTP
jgi:hypothetical protein